jgi:hypothetical protein
MTVAEAVEIIWAGTSVLTWEGQTDKVDAAEFEEAIAIVFGV